MIYVGKKDFERQIALLTFVAKSQELNVCAWLYPESNVTKLAGIEVTDNPLLLSLITTYENGFSPRCTACIPASGVSIRSFGTAYAEMKKNCDSLALYRISHRAWLAATIRHEGLCLVQDDSLLNSLTLAE